ncbi:MAG: NapC/NirT family cytochrome c [Alphaproteobacteria bacterium]|nr:NapC/NirT family cytochrome c [Alphaproteobacteria bacterium]
MLMWGGFNWSLEITNTEDFCVSCHAMRDYVFKEYKQTIHYNNRTGVRASCPDCHVPREWIHKVIRKVQASNELYHWALGSIDSPQAFEAKRGALAAQVWRGTEATRSRECRNCHDIEFMAKAKQAKPAQVMHELAERWNYTCIDCHKGIAHSLPRDFDASKIMDTLHDRFESEKIECRRCHVDMVKPPPGQGW